MDALLKQLADDLREISVQLRGKGTFNDGAAFAYEMSADMADERATTLAAREDGWRPMDSAPKDGTLLRLLVEFTEHPIEDTNEPTETIGANSFDNNDEDEWKFAGWCWEQDCFTQGEGRPVGWLPMIATPPTAQGTGEGDG